MIPLKNVLKTSLQDVLKTLLQDVRKMFWKQLGKTSWRCLEDAWPRQIYWFWPRSLEDVFWRRMSMGNIFVLIKTSSENKDERRLHQDKCLVDSLPKRKKKSQLNEKYRMLQTAINKNLSNQLLNTSQIFNLNGGVNDCMKDWLLNFSNFWIFDIRLLSTDFWIFLNPNLHLFVFNKSWIFKSHCIHFLFYRNLHGKDFDLFSIKNALQIFWRVKKKHDMMLTRVVPGQKITLLSKSLFLCDRKNSRQLSDTMSITNTALVRIFIQRHCEIFRYSWKTEF